MPLCHFYHVSFTLSSLSFLNLWAYSFHWIWCIFSCFLNLWAYSFHWIWCIFSHVALSIFILSLFVLSFGDISYIRLLDIVPQFINSISLFFCLPFPFSLCPFLPRFLLWVLFWIAYIAISSGLLVFLLQWLICCWSSPSVFLTSDIVVFTPISDLKISTCLFLSI